MGVSPTVIKFVGACDIETLMKRHGYYDDLDSNDILLLMNRFDKDNDGRISINEFFEQIQP